MMLITMRVATGLLAMLLFGACSCAGSSDAIQKELSDIRSEMVKLRAQNAILTDRVDSMERAAHPVPAARLAPPPQDADRPALEVVRLAPELPASPPAEATPEHSTSRGAQDSDRAAGHQWPSLRPPVAEPAAAAPDGPSRPVLRLTGKAGADARPPVKPSPPYAKP